MRFTDSKVGDYQENVKLRKYIDLFAAYCLQ